MAKIKIIKGSQGERIALFFCPGCGYNHPYQLDIPAANGAMWTFNEDMEKPTFTPSLLCNKGTEVQCHLHVTDGKIIYSPDCFHDLKNQILDLQELPNYNN